MTTKRTVYLRSMKNNEETLGVLYVSRHPATRKYVATVILGDRNETQLVASNEAAEDWFRAVYNQRDYREVLSQPMSRTQLRVARWNGLEFLAHGKSAIPLLPEHMKLLAQQKSELDVRRAVSSLYPDVEKYRALASSWSEDDTIGSTKLAEDIARLQTSEEDYDPPLDEWQSNPMKDTRGTSLVDQLKARVVAAEDVSMKAPWRCPSCEVGVLAYGKTEPMYLNENGMPYCRVHAGQLSTEYCAESRAYWARRGQKQHAIDALSVDDGTKADGEEP